MFARFREFNDWTGSVLQGWCQQQLFFFTQYRSYFTPNGWFAYEPQVLIRFCCPNEERSGADILSRWRTSPVTKPSECLLSSRFPIFWRWLPPLQMNGPSLRCRLHICFALLINPWSEHVGLQIVLPVAALIWEAAVQASVEPLGTST